uniref:Uncharacterized protein n=1 Tax=Aceria tosichella TaxID=561515 RepID=A0A6G1SNH5_9ACAR
MIRITLVAALAVVALSGSAFAGLEGEVQNKFIVTYNVVPDPFGLFAFYTMPRTTKEAEKSHFSQVAERSEDKTTVWCRKGDHRVCVLFDQQGTVAGIQISVSKKELDSVNAPGLNVKNIPEIFPQIIGNLDVYSTIAYFVNKETLTTNGGRLLAEETLTAPDGIYLLQTDINGVETGRLLVSNDESDALSAGFTEQACFHGMGKHYFQDLKKDGTCDAHRPYFLLYGPHTNKLNGFGLTMYGKPTQGRGWFETPPALVAKMIAPNSPSCMTQWINKYGLFTMHVFFVEKPWNTWCL